MTTKPKAGLPLSIKTLLVPIDFSPRSNLVVKYAGALAQKFGAVLELLYVIEQPTLFYSGIEYAALVGNDEELLHRAQQSLEKLAEKEVPPGVRATILVQRGKASTEIVATARKRRSDLIVIQTHNNTGLDRMLMGDTAGKVIRDAPCAVLTVRPGSIGASKRNGDNGLSIRRILAPVDLSQPSNDALRYAIEMARRYEAELIILHVAFSVPPPQRLAAYARRLEAAAMADAKRDVATLIKQKVRYSPVTTEIVAGIAHDEIVRAAKRLKADLVVIATHGRTGFKRWLIGSTAEQVIRHAETPVLVVRRPKAKRRTPRKGKIILPRIPLAP